jgi:ferredoxin-NADP reductase
LAGPQRGICKNAFDIQLHIDIILLYGNKSIDDIPFKQVFDQIQKRSNNLKGVQTLINLHSNFEGYAGYINAELLRKEVADFASRLFYSCSPPAMVAVMKKQLNEINLTPKQIITENFSSY